ncbi:deoxyribodipyrimidine photo-lyase [Rhodocytophaga rosea]|uniref:Deoxyribodipyrimidine photo-lyase n=1 Tax=Rhodocytophaga rosea TaxID=2704465 RepID=A0A6C0GF90_9BACT|nr:deoxyribodipyrimidine photo-lyase [Rhodocytophaga rosea]QHT66618.1 deoxyribodipyrimidine photo-lyase [Rhodocytophaga rosea]
MSTHTTQIAVFWFRRDLRIEDNTGLYHALNSGYPVLPLFIFDSDILDQLEDRDDGRVTFIHQVVSDLQQAFDKQGGTLLTHYGKPVKIWKQLLREYIIVAVYTNHDYESYAINRDTKIRELLQTRGIPFHTYKDQVIFEKQEIVNGQGNPYKVFTPYSKKWLATLTDAHTQHFLSGEHISALYKSQSELIPSLPEMGFQKSALIFPSMEVREDILEEYARERNFPAKPGTTKIGIHLRFGTVSIREMVRKAIQHSDIWLNELIWRDFYMMILANFPHVEQSACKPAYDQIQWRNNEQEYKLWCMGQTGYPIVDAGMRELNATGFMHNRVRMITASFLVKHLLIDWRWGEAYFAGKLLDYELASNNGSWQWIAGSGCDAAPYFRVFNPNTQAAKFDKAKEYIKKWIPELGTPDYPKPIITHEFARERVLATYLEALKKGMSVG